MFYAHCGHQQDEKLDSYKGNFESSWFKVGLPVSKGTELMSALLAELPVWELMQYEFMDHGFLLDAKTRL
eukprot:scaffold648280_cov47-Prasinocladus_malaysianus.AAC.1